MGLFENYADYEMADLERKGNIAHNLKKKGICLHGWRQGGDPGNPYDNSKCLDCGKTGKWWELEMDSSKYL